MATLYKRFYWLTFFSLMLTSFAWGQKGESMDDMFDDFDDEQEVSPFQFKGFLDARYGPRFVTARQNEHYTLGEVRGNAQIDFEKKGFLAKASLDLIYSPLQNIHIPDGEQFQQGEGFFDVRELSAAYTLFGNTDLKLGRQVLTWGTGDLLFINDLFPKDWKSFFTGRPDNYLKAPANNLKVSHFTPWFSLDLVYTPLSGPSRFIDGRVLEYYSPLTGDIAGENAAVDPEFRSTHLKHGEYAARLHKVFQGVELDAYFYRGYWKTPEGVTNASRPYFPELSVTGTSVRLPFLGGMSSFEYGHYFSHEDKGSRTAFVRNSEDRLLIGYERELFKNFTASTQGYLEKMNNYTQYSKDFSGGSRKKEEYHTMITLRLEYAIFNQNLRISLFNFYSPDNEDYYMRNRLTYKYTDQINFDLGLNYFDGTSNNAFWSQFYSNSNVYVGATYHY